MRRARFVAYGRGYSGGYATQQEAEAVVSRHGQGGVFVEIGEWARLTQLAQGAVALGAERTRERDEARQFLTEVETALLKVWDGKDFGWPDMDAFVETVRARHEARRRGTRPNH